MKLPLRLALVLSLTGCASGPPPSARHALLGKHVSLDLPTDTGNLVSVPWRGPRSYVVDFWGTTCVPCRAKLPALVAKKRELEARGASLVLVGVLGPHESAESAREVLSSWGVLEPFLVSSIDASKERASVSAVPATLVLDAGGELRWAAPDHATAEDVVRAVP